MHVALIHLLNLSDANGCQEAVVEKSLREYIKEPDVVGECLQYVRKSTNGVEENTVFVVYTNSHYKRRNGWPCATEHLHDSIHVSLPVPLRFGHICKCETCQPWR